MKQRSLQITLSDCFVGEKAGGYAVGKEFSFGCEEKPIPGLHYITLMNKRLN